MKAPILYLVAVATFKNIKCCPSSIKNPIIIGPTKDPNMKYVLVFKINLGIHIFSHYAIYQSENY